MSYTIIENDILENQNFNIQEQALFIALLSYYNKKKGYSYPSYKQLMKRSKIKQDRTLIKAIRSLINKGYITKDVKVGVGTKYYLHTANLQYLQKCSTLISITTPTIDVQDDLLQKGSTISTTTIINIYTDDFEKFYKLYPNPHNKEQTFKNWKTSLKEHTAEEIITATLNYIKYTKTNKTEMRFIVRSSNFVGEKQEYKEYLPKVDKSISEPFIIVRQPHQ